MGFILGHCDCELPVPVTVPVPIPLFCPCNNSPSVCIIFCPALFIPAPASAPNTPCTALCTIYIHQHYTRIDPLLAMSLVLPVLMTQIPQSPEYFSIPSSVRRPARSSSAGHSRHNRPSTKDDNHTADTPRVIPFDLLSAQSSTRRYIPHRLTFRSREDGRGPAPGWSTQNTSAATESGRRQGR